MLLGILCPDDTPIVCRSVLVDQPGIEPASFYFCTTFEDWYIAWLSLVNTYKTWLSRNASTLRSTSLSLVRLLSFDRANALGQNLFGYYHIKTHFAFTGLCYTARLNCCYLDSNKDKVCFNMATSSSSKGVWPLNLNSFTILKHTPLGSIDKT